MWSNYVKFVGVVVNDLQELKYVWRNCMKFMGVVVSDLQEFNVSSYMYLYMFFSKQIYVMQKWEI